MRYEPVDYRDLPGWAEDDHAAALAAFRLSADDLRKAVPDLSGGDADNARGYFEANFVPHRVVHGGVGGLFTGYYEPILSGSRTRSGRFSVPLLRRPPDLETLVDDRLRASSADALTHARRVDGDLHAFPVREEIEKGCLVALYPDGCNLEFMYLEDPVDAFFLHVQGSGLIELDDGDRVRVGYAAKNGHPYTSIGQSLIADGIFAPDTMSLAALTDWLKADPERGKRTMWRNKSYIFFEERGDAATAQPLGAQTIPLTEGRSLAVDASLHRIGLPVFVSINGLDGVSANGRGDGFRRLMIAQDVGSAIRGAERGDIFYGSGPAAGALAGNTKHQGCMFVLLPKVDAGGAA